MTIPFNWRLISDIVTGLSSAALFYANSIANEREEELSTNKRGTERGREKKRERERRPERMGRKRGTRKWWIPVIKSLAGRQQTNCRLTDCWTWSTNHWPPRSIEIYRVLTTLVPRNSSILSGCVGCFGNLTRENISVVKQLYASIWT